MNEIWRHPISQAALFVGDAGAASNKAGLEQHGIRHLVNCQGHMLPNRFDKEPTFHYHRCPISEWTDPTTLDLRTAFQETFTFIDQALDAGHPVLVHCMAGCHRAGAVAICYYMHASHANVLPALKAVQAKRPGVQPYGVLTTICHQLDEEYRQHGWGHSSTQTTNPTHFEPPR